MVQLVKHDLEYILKQIKIAEEHAKGKPLTELVDDPLLPYGLRTVDGSFNNLVPGREQWGAADQPFVQITDPTWRNDQDGDSMGMGPIGVPGVPQPVTNTNYGVIGESTVTPDDPTDNEVNGGHTGNVADADPRLISNLIVDQTLNNPAAIAAALEHAGLSGAALTAAQKAVMDAHTLVKAIPPGMPGHETAKTQLETLLDQYGIEMDGPTILLPNVAPDIGDSASYSSIFTLFGQFFDHGLDLVAKGGNGTIYMPLSPDDPLYDPAKPHTNFMVLTRASVGDDARNTTTPWVDQNQTYGSHASKQVFMREYAIAPEGAEDPDGNDISGKPYATGKLLQGSTGGPNGTKGGLATWADVKAHAAEFLGIKLTDKDVGNIPLIVTDEYGNFIPGANGYAQLVVGLGADGILGTEDDVLKEGDPNNPVDPSEVGAFRTGHAFLDDIAHNAVPVLVNNELAPDGDDAVGYTGGVNNQGQNTHYDDELLDRHFITGDGRGNENIGLTAIHHVFHGEHNLIVEQTKIRAIEAAIEGDVSFLKEWLIVKDIDFKLGPDATEADKKAYADSLAWDGERLFQAGRFVTEMEYQHLVFEEFARKMQPDVDAFLFEPDPDINPAIFAEFANVVYRFGHSMLNENVDRVHADGSADNMSLFAAFLNPVAYDNDGTLTHDQAAGAILRGMSAQVGNEIDEFVTDTLRNQLLGIPLDLAAINIARGRDTGMPTLNEARAQFKKIANGDSQLDPYTSWTDFALNLKNPASIINFIAAYGTHDLITSQDTIEGKRAAAMAIVFGTSETFYDVIDKEMKTITPPSAEDRSDFLNARGAYANDPELGGLQNVDLWVGGLAEKKMDFGGMLGSTFSFIFELQLENLQDGDRFYYLSRVQGMNLLSELESNSLAKMMLRNSDLGEEGTAVPGDIFSRPDLVLYADHDKQMEMTGQDDPQHTNPVLQALSKLVERFDDTIPTGLAALNLPNGVTFDPVTRTFSGTLPEGVFEATITATYASGNTRSQTVKILVIDPVPLADHLDVLVDDTDYFELYPDVAASPYDADDHYAEWGRGEKRKPNKYFDPVWYLEQNPDVVGVMDPLEHYMQYGWKEGRNPSAQFDVQRYFLANPDVAEAGMDPLYHYLRWGRGEGRAIYPAQPDSHVVVTAGQSFNYTLPLENVIGGQYLRYNGTDHAVLQGTNGHDTLIGGEGDDSLWGLDGDDRLEGGYGVDHVHGGDGDDIITNAGTDIAQADFLHGDAGNDVIHGGAGLTLIFGNSGSDFIVAGPDGKTVMGGTENDYILGGDGMDFIMGEAGDDWLEGGGRFDTLAGENSELFFNSTIIGHDILNGSNGDVDYDAESGDDIMFQGVGIQRNNGMAGFDWAIHKFDPVAANSDLGIGIFQNQEQFILRDRFDLVEGLSGWKFNDVLTGRVAAVGARDEIIGGAAIPAPDDPFYSWSNALTEQGVARIDGLRELLSHLTWDTSNPDAIVMQTGDGSDILLGGDGSDTFEGKGGNDVIDGDAWLNVRIRFVKDGVAYTTDGLTTPIYLESEYVDGAPLPDAEPQFGGRALTDLTFTREVNPGILENVREIVYADGSDDTDTAIYAGPMSMYEITHVGDKVFVARRESENIDPAVDEGMDVLINIERIQFQDQVYVIRDTGNIAPTGRLVINNLPATAGVELTVSAEDIRDENNPGGMVTGITYRWQVERNDGTGEYIDIDGVTGNTFTPGPEHTGLRIRVIGTYRDAGGVPETVYSLATEGVIGVNEPPTGQLLISDMSPTEGQMLTATVAFTDPNGMTDAFEEALMSYIWEMSDDPNGDWGPAAEPSATDRTFTPTKDHVGKYIRVAVQYTDDLGNAHRVESAVTTIVGNHIETNVDIVSELVPEPVDDTDLRTTAGDDIVIAGNGDNTIFGGAGGDSLDGGDGNDSLDGGTGNDTLIGGIGNDTVNGGDGNDTIVYRDGDGADVIDGGLGSDTLRITEASAESDDTIRVTLTNGRISQINEASVSNVESMQLDLGGGVDTLDYNGHSGDLAVNLLFGSATGFNFVRGVENVIGGTGNDELLGNNADNALVGAGGKDTLRGGHGNDDLSGGVDDDQLYGEEGDDVLNGGAGNDRIDGGVGSDTASYAGTTGPVTVSLAVIGEQNTGGAGRDTLIGIENLTGSDHDDTLIGNAGDNVLDGGAGVDVMEGGDGNDTYVVDNDLDVVTEAEDGGDNDTVRTSLQSYTLAANVENLVLLEGAVSGTGNELNNVLTGNSGNNTLNGGEGTDIVVLDGAITDYTFSLVGGNVTVTSAAGGTDTLINIERVRIGGVVYNLVPGTGAANSPLAGADGHDLILGFGGADSLTGGGDDDILIGGAGADTMAGGAGNDTYVVEQGTDVVIENSEEGTDTILSYVNRNLGNAAQVQGDVENLVLLGNATNGTGNGLANVITGNANNNTLAGNAGNDTLIGGEGNDTLNGGADNDVLSGGAGDDTLNGGAGIDVAVFDGPAGNYRFGFNAAGTALTSVTDLVDDGGTDTLNGIERLQFADGEVLDVIIGGATPTTGAGLIFGTDGDDVITGGNGDDVIIGGAGNDTLYGHDVGDGDNPVAGPADDDTFIWRAGETGFDDGADVINGGTEGEKGDTLVIIGNHEAETYRIYTYDEAVTRIGYAGSDENEIIITRQVGGGPEADATIIAEITEIEEIIINGASAGGNGESDGDRFEIYGDFANSTSLRPNTITIEGTDGDDVVDISSLLSSHRIVFRSKGGNDTIVGTLRPQDVIELPDGATAEDYEVTTDENGVTTMSNGTHSVRFVSEGGLPQVGPGNGNGEGDGGDTSAPGNGGDGDGNDTSNPDTNDDEDTGTGDNGGETSTPPATQPGSSVGAPIAGTNSTEALVGTAAGETIMALDGNDNVVAGAGDDVVHGGAGSDFLSGEAGRDIMFGGDGDDTMFGGDDADMLYGDAGNDRIFGDNGNDLIDAGMGNDIVYGGAGDDRIMASVGDGNDVYYGDDMVGGISNDTLDMSAITANITANLGGNGASYGTVASSQSGTDTIWGIENIVTGSGSDTITASAAVNVIDGGGGNDIFRFLSAADANGDTILGFQPGDRIDLSAIDANGDVSGKQAFTLTNGSSFTGPAQLVISHETREDGEYTVVSGNVIGPDAAEFKISLKGNHDLKESDFILS